jgi:Flp pilus assembly protein TadB
VKLDRKMQRESTSRQTGTWGLSFLAFVAVVYFLHNFFISQTVADGLTVAAGTLLAYLVLLLKISERQAHLELEAKSTEWQ